MWQDADTSDDYLNFDEVAYLSANVIRQSEMLPVSLGIYGGWGTGKSTIMNLIETQLSGDASQHGKAYLICRFDAWIFQGYDDAKASLMEVIGRHLIEYVEDNRNLRDRARTLLGRVNYFRALGSIADFGAMCALGVPTWGLGGKAAQSVDDLVSGEGNAEDWNQVKQTGRQLQSKLSGFVNTSDTKTPPHEIGQFRKEFSSILKEKDVTLVVFIDNLDRCLPRQAIETLEAIRLFLFLPRTAFIIAADEEMIRHSVRTYFTDPNTKHVTDYLDKIIQVPVHVPLLGISEVKGYMFLLFMKMCRVPEYDFQQVQSEICRRASRAWEEKQLTKDDILNTCSVKDDSLANRLDIAENLAPLLARSSAIQGNPRIVKRMLNTLSMRTDLAHRRGIPIDERLLAKLVTFERCTDNRAYQELVQIIGNAPNGAPEKLKELEDAASSGKLSKESLPNDWNTFHEFIEEWLVLPPSLVDRDLRPALYLSRETAPIVTPAGEMSRHSVKALATLRQVTSINSEAGKSAVKGLTLNDAHGVMDRLISDLRAQERIEISTPFAGAILLANHYAQTQEALRSFLNSLPQGSISAGNMQRLKGLTWAESLRSRSKSPNNS